MEIQIHNWTGYEAECEVAYFEHLGGDYLKTYYLTNLNTRLFIDEDGASGVEILSVECHTYDDQDNEIKHTLTENEIWQLEGELWEYVDWDEWIDSQKYD